MNVLYTCDNNYVWLMGISTISLFENNKHINDLTVYLLGKEITDENKKLLNEIADKYDRHIIIIDSPKLNIPSSLVSSRWPESAFVRLYSGQLLPNEVSKVLYLDCDTIVSGDIQELVDLSYDEKIVYGVKDCISGTYKKNIGLDRDGIYINAGVLLLGLDKLRQINISEEIEAYMNRYEKYINYADQDILNGIFSGKIGELSPKFDVMTINVVHSYDEIVRLRRPTNYYSKEELAIATQNPAIIHYTTNMDIVRPWFLNSNHPKSNEFLSYLEMSPWRDKQLDKMIFSSKESKIISFINLLPKKIAFRILGFLHAELKPRYINFRAKRR